MIGLTLVSTVTVVAASMKASVADVLAKSSCADFSLKAASRTALGLPAKLAEQLRGVDDVAVAAELRMAPAQVDGRATMVDAVDPATIGKVVDLAVSSGSVTALDAGSVLVSDRAAKAHGWRVGDEATLTYAQTGAHRFRIAGTFTDTALLGGDYVTTLATHTANGGSPLDIAVMVRAQPGADLGTVRAKLAAVTAAYPNATLQDAASFVQQQGKTVDQLLGAVTALLALTVLIALLGIVNTLALSVFERTRELGLLRAVGMGRRQVRAVVRWEAVIVAVLGALLGAGSG